MRLRDGGRGEGGRDLALFGGMLALLGGLATLFRIDALHPSYAAHFIAQAHSWLHGRQDVPGWLGHDLVSVRGRWYIVYPPFPALLMLPFVALLGDRFSDIWFTWLLGAANVVLLRRLLQTLSDQGHTGRTARENTVIAVTFGAGTIALWLALGGTVWFTAQTLALTCLLTMFLAAFRRVWWLAATALGALFLTRSPDVLAAIVPVVLFARSQGWGGNAGRQPDAPPLGPTLAGIAAPLAVALGLWLVRNALVFGSPLSSGYDLQIAQDYPQIHYGLLSWHYLWPNFVVAFLNLPAFQFTSPFDVAPTLDLLRGGNGTSVFFTTPLFLLLFAPGEAAGATRWLRRTLWATALALVGFALLWNGTGWEQVGARYLFDAYPCGFLLLALRRAALSRRWLALAAAGVTINIALAETFWRHGPDLLTAPLGLRGLAFVAALALGPALGVAAWRWLRADVAPPALLRPYAPEARLASE